jgi:hypothetical protein
VVEEPAPQAQVFGIEVARAARRWKIGHGRNRYQMPRLTRRPLRAVPANRCDCATKPRSAKDPTTTLDPRRRSLRAARLWRRDRANPPLRRIEPPPAAARRYPQRPLPIPDSLPGSPARSPSSRSRPRRCCEARPGAAEILTRRTLRGRCRRSGSRLERLPQAMLYAAPDSPGILTLSGREAAVKRGGRATMDSRRCGALGEGFGGKFNHARRRDR